MQQDTLKTKRIQFGFSQEWPIVYEIPGNRRLPPFLAARGGIVDNPLMSPILLALRFLWPMDGRRELNSPGWSRAGLWLPLWGLVFGVVYMLIYRGAWRWFGEYYHLRLIPPVAVIAVDAGWLGYRLLAGATEQITGRPRDEHTPQAVTLPALLLVVIVLLAKYAILISIPIGAKIWPTDWRHHLDPLFPEVVYRPLLLMPLWGRWSMMLALLFGPADAERSPRLHSMSRPIRPLGVLLMWLACAIITVYLVAGDATHLPQCLVIVLIVMVVAYLTGFLLVRKNRALDESVVHTVGLAGELAFLIVYIPVASHIYMY